MLEVGEEIPAARVWMAPREQLTLDALADDGAVLIFFYLFDWSAT